jgi:hypothetical protein
MHGVPIGPFSVPPGARIGLVRCSRTQQSHSLRWGVHLRMKSQGRGALFSGGSGCAAVARCPSRVPVGRDRGAFEDTAIAVPREGPAYSLCGIFAVPVGLSWGSGERRRRGVAPGASGWNDSVVVRVTDVAKRRRQGLVACRAALPFEGLLDARPGVAPAPPFGAVVRQSSTRRR